MAGQYVRFPNAATGSSALSVTAFQGGVWTVGRTWNLDFATDSVDVSGSTVNVAGTVPVSGTVTALQGTNPWIVAATNLDIRDLVFATDKVDVSGSLVSINGTVPVSGTVTALQGTSPWVVSGTVAATQSGVWSVGRTWNLIFSSDSVQNYGFDGANLQAIRTDTTGQQRVVLAANNDGALRITGDNELRVSDTLHRNNGLESALSVSSVVEAKVGASTLTDRKLLTIQPTNGNIVFGYNNTVTASTGTIIYQGQILGLSSTHAVFIVAVTGTVNVRITESA